jgi:hypothetical protein
MQTARQVVEMTVEEVTEAGMRERGGMVKFARAAFVVVLALGALSGQAQSLAPGFTALPANAKVVITPIDVE